MSRKHDTRLNSAIEVEQGFCETCEHDIPADESNFHCFTCEVQFHLTEACTNISKGALYGIIELENNALLLCHACVTSKQKDRLTKTASKKQQPKEDKQLKQLQSEISDIKKAISKLKVSVDKNASVPTVSPPNEPAPRPQPMPVPPMQPEGIRVRGVLESTSKLARERNEHDMAEIKTMLTFLSVWCQISELKRMGAYQCVPELFSS